MKRYLILTFLLILSNTQINKNIKDVINVIDNMILQNWTSIKDKELYDYLGESCLNDEFMKSIDQFIYGIQIKNPNEMSLAIISMFTDITSSCDTSSTFEAGKKLFNNLNQVDFLTIAMKRLRIYTYKFVDLYTNPYSNANDTGEFIGFILYDLIKYSHNETEENQTKYNNY